jgi:replication factor C subunit 1
MNISSIQGKTIALCGEFDFDINVYLQSLNVHIVPWSPKLDFVLCGKNYKDRVKYKTALTSEIPIHEWSQFVCPKQLWSTLYAPQSSSDIIGHTDVVKAIKGWLGLWTATGVNGDTPRGVFLSGPPGIGKTTLAHIVCREAGFTVIEMNASDCRSASQIKEQFETAVRSRVVGGRRVIIMDEVDGMSSGDRGGVGELVKLIRESVFPFLCIANDRSGPKLRPLVNICLDLKCTRPTKTIIAKLLYDRICKSEHLTCSVRDLEHLCETSGNDIRQIINTLQFGGSGGGKDAILRMDPFSATGLLFKGGGDLDTRMNYVYLDHGLVPLMVNEAYVAAAGRGAGIPGVVAAADACTQFDVYDSRIHRQQTWSLLPSAVIHIVHAAACSAGPAPFQIFPQFLGKMSKARKQKRWMSMLAQRLRVHRDTALDMRETLRLRLFRSGENASKIVDRLLEYGISRDDMLETLAETVFPGDETTVTLDTKTKSAITREWKKRAPQTIDTVCAYSSDSDDEESE